MAATVYAPSRMAKMLPSGMSNSIRTRKNKMQCDVVSLMKANRMACLLEKYLQLTTQKPYVDSCLYRSSLTRHVLKEKPQRTQPVNQELWRSCSGVEGRPSSRSPRLFPRLGGENFICCALQALEPVSLVKLLL